MSKLMSKDKIDEIVELRRALVLWLRRRLAESERSGYVIGMSGGVDSAVLTMLAQEAVAESGGSVMAVIAPSEDSVETPRTIELCQRFDIPYKVLDLAEPFIAMKRLLGAEVTASMVSYTNLAARLRVAALYFLANNLHYLVLGTVNMAEFYLGYFPKNASVGDLLPFADVLKKEIRAIGASYNLPDSVIQAKASGCVWAQTAEEEWGITEEEVDVILESLNDNMQLPEDFCAVKFDKVKVFFERLRDSEHKRRFNPIFKR